MNKKLLRKKLALMLANLKKPRPYYCEVEYLETTGQQTNATDTTNASWIDTGIVPDNTTQMECRVAFTTLVSGTNTEALFGSTGASTGNYRFAFGYASISPYTNFYFGLGGQNLTTSLTRDTNVHTFKIDAVNKTWAIDDTSGSFTSSGSLSSTSSIFLFARHNPAYGDNKANKPANARTHYCKIWQGGSLVRDMIPVLDWNYTPCMYDKITGQLFYNAGTGDFVAGREIHQVEYIQTIYSADGNSFIDTGYYPNFNTKVEFMASGISADTFTGSSGGTWFTGGRQAYQQKMFGSYYNPSSQNLYFCFSTSLNMASFLTTNMYGDNKKFVLDKTGLYVNDTKVVNNTTTTDFTSPATLAIFGLNNNGTIISPTGMKIQYYKIWDNDVLTRDYIPMVDENGVGALFDKVTHTIYDAVGYGTGFKYPAKEVKYLESAGTQYINTGHAFTDNFAWEIDFEGLTKGATLFGGRTSSTRTALLYQKATAQGVETTCPIDGMTGDQTPFQLADLSSNRHKVKMSVASNKGSVWVDDVQVYNEQSFTGTYISGTTQALFADNFGSSVSEYTSSKVYALKMWQGSNLVRDFIPCYKDGSLGMWDKANEVFYQNSGTGTFTTGKIVEPEYE